MLNVTTVACFKWTPQPGYRSQYGPETVNTLQRMVARHYSPTPEFVCITDDTKGLDKSIRVVPLWNDLAHLPAPQGGKNPSCYRRLKVFSKEMGDVLGQRFVVMDLDMLITGDLAPVWNRPEDFVIIGDTNVRTPYNGSMMLMSAGARAKVWETFDPVRSPALAKAANYFGSDQAWISWCLGRGEAKWTIKDGVYSFRNHLAMHRHQLPENARVINWHGKFDPWSGFASQIAWVKTNYK